MGLRRCLRVKVEHEFIGWLSCEPKLTSGIFPENFRHFMFTDLDKHGFFCSLFNPLQLSKFEFWLLKGHQQSELLSASLHQREREGARGDQILEQLLLHVFTLILHLDWSREGRSKHLLLLLRDLYSAETWSAMCSLLALDQGHLKFLQQLGCLGLVLLDEFRNLVSNQQQDLAKVLFPESHLLEHERAQGV